MSILKNILGKFFATWALLVFITSMLVFYIPFLLTVFWKEPVRTTYFINLAKAWMSVFFFFTGVKRKFKGREYFQKGENYIVLCNHNTFMDVPLSSAGIPGVGNKTIAKKEFTKVPLFGIIYRRGSVLVDRKSEESRKASFGHMKAVLQIGLHMCIYPEGTRNKTNEPLQPFKDGAFRLAKETGKHIIPTLLFYTKDVMPTHKGFFFWPRKVEMHFLPPVNPTDYKTAEDLKEDVYNRMKTYYTNQLAAEKIN